KSLTASVRYYPWTVHRGLFVEAGPTYSQALVRLTDTTGLARHGWGVTAGVGGDVLPRWRVMFVPRLAFTYAWVGDGYSPLGSRTLFAGAWRHWVLHFGLDLGFRDRYRNEGQARPRSAAVEAACPLSRRERGTGGEVICNITVAYFGEPVYDMQR